MAELVRKLSNPPAALRWRDDQPSARALPSCSIRSCENAAGVVFHGELLCGVHANEVFARRQKRAAGN
jgi:hypothetical protein